MLCASGSGAIRVTVPMSLRPSSASTVTTAGRPTRTFCRLASCTATSAMMEVVRGR